MGIRNDRTGESCAIRRAMRLQSLQVLCSALLLCVCLISNRADAANTVLKGGPFGNEFTRSCSSGKTMIGIRGRAGDYVDRIKAICARFDHTLMATSVGSTNYAGGTGGTRDFEYRCPTGQALVGLHGKSALYVDRIGIRCAPLDDNGKFANTWVHSVPFTTGGKGGDSFSLTCSKGEPARGLRGKAGSWIDAIGLACGKATIQTFSATPGPRPDARVVIRDLPWIAKEGSSLRFSVELWNIGSGVLPEGAEVDIESEKPNSMQRFEVAFRGLGSCDMSRYPVRCRTGRATPSGEVIMAVEINGIPSWPPGDFDYVAKADPQGLIDEANEGNNVRSERLRLR